MERWMSRESEPKESLQIIPCLLAVTRLFTFLPRPVYSSLFPSPLLTSSEASGTSKTRKETVRRVTRMTSDTRWVRRTGQHWLFTHHFLNLRLLPSFQCQCCPLRSHRLSLPFIRTERSEEEVNRRRTTDEQSERPDVGSDGEGKVALLSAPHTRSLRHSSREANTVSDKGWGKQKMNHVVTAKN